ncbi:MAG: preprotein translocase subunit SecE [Planctomycetota bacterium]|jgi:preprotein translocase subunit SecE
MKFDIYKRGQGKYTRLWSAFGLWAIIALGCWPLYRILEAGVFGVSRRAALWLATMVPAGLFIVSGLLIFWLVNKPSVADFMIAAEGEIKKVSWSSRKEIAVSTFIVIVVVVVMAVLLGTTDLVFFQLFSWLLG